MNEWAHEWVYDWVSEWSINWNNECASEWAINEQGKDIVQDVIDGFMGDGWVM